MGEQRLVWSGDGQEYEGFTTWGTPVAIGEAGGGAKPSDLLPLSLAACTAYDVVVILRKQRQTLRALEVLTTSEQEPDPPWTFVRIHQHFVLTGAISWLFIGGHVVEDEVGVAGTAAFLALFALLGYLAAMPGSRRR